MGCIKLCVSFHITPVPREGLIPIVSHCSVPGLCSRIGPGSAQCEYTIRGAGMVTLRVNRASGQLKLFISQAA